jgi:hypothetical protein
MPPQPRELTDDYRLERILASSRGASILAASALASGQAVVVKLINVPAAASAARAAAVAARFSAAAEALAALSHPNLPRILDAGLTPDGGAFLVMERLEGVTFDAHTLTAGTSPEQVLPLLAQALAGLEELARHGLAHFNVAPETLFVVGGSASRPSSPPTVKLLGMGTPLFHLGEAWNEAETARFRAPELALPAAAAAALADWHADCYSLALTACNALGATVAFGEAPGPIVQMPLALSFELDNDEALRQILERCLRRVPAQRPNHAEVRAAFGLALGTQMASGAEPGSRPAAGAVTEKAAPASPAVLPPTAGRPSFTSGAGAAPEEGWRSALSSRVPAAEAPSWRTAKPLDTAPAAPPTVRTAVPPAIPKAPTAISKAPVAPADAPPRAAEDNRGDDSSLDLFAVPDSLPDLLPGGAPLRAAAPSGPVDAATPTASEMAAALGLNISAGPIDQTGSSFGSSLWEGADMPEEALGGAAPAALTGAAALSAAALTGLAAQPPTAHAPEAASRWPTAPQSPAAQVVAQLPMATPSSGTAYAAAAPAAAPPPASEAPQGGEMLSAVDDLLGSLPPPPTVQPVTAAQRQARPSGGAVPAPAGAAGRTAAVAVAGGRPSPLAFALGLPRPLLLGAASALVIVVAAGGFFLLHHRSAQAGAPAAAVAADAAGTPPEKPGRTAAAKFFDAKSYLILGRESDGRVRLALRDLSFGEQGELGEDGCRELGSIEQTLALAALETAPQDLANGLRNGDLGALDTVVGVASPQDVPANQRADLERARSLVKLYDEAQAAAARGDQAEVLDRFRAMEGLSRTLHDPLALRDKAAATLEAAAAALAQEGNYDQAIGRLEPLRRSWPERAGIKELLKTYESAAANETSQLAILDQVPNILRRRKPSEGLDMLRAVKPTPHLAARIQDAIQQLEAQLAQLDAQPPQVALRDDFPLDYSRGQVVTLSFRVTDDYQVKSVRMFARPEGGGMREMPLQRQGLSYTIEIPPSFHQNGTVDFYVVATDLSGHEGTLGSREKPMQLKRRQGFERMLH